MGKLASPLSFSKSCTSHMYVSGVSLFRESPIVFEVKPSKPCLNVTSNRETLHDNLQRGSYTLKTKPYEARVDQPHNLNIISSHCGDRNRTITKCMKSSDS